MSENKMNVKKSPKLNLDLTALGKKKEKTINCPHCPICLNAKYNHTTEHVEAIDGTKVRKLEYYRCNKSSWKCESCVSDHLCENRAGAVRHKRKYHKIISKETQNEAARKEVMIDDLPMDMIENDNHFGELRNEADWMLFTNNLRSIHPSHATFMKAIHGGSADKFLVCNSQDKGHACEEKLKKHDKTKCPFTLT